LTRFGVPPFGGDNAEAQSVAVRRIYNAYLAKANEHAGVKRTLNRVMRSLWRLSGRCGPCAH
jgi:hypothetical protein